MGGVGRHTIIYGIGILLNKAVSFLMLPVYTRFLTPADYGVMELIEMTLDLIAIIAGARLAVGIFRYYHKADTEHDRNTVVSTALMTLAGSYAGVGLLTCLLAGPLSHLIFHTGEYAVLIRLAAGTLALQSLLLVPLTHARAQNRSTLFVTANAVKLFIGLGLNIVLVVNLHYGVLGVFIANFVSTLVVGGWLAADLVRRVGLHFSREATRNLLRYGVPLIGTQIATFILTFGDRYFLQARGGSTDVGLYSLAYQFGFLLASIGYIPFEMVWEPTRFEVAKREDRHEIYARGFLYMNALLLTMAVGLALAIPVLLQVMTTPAFYSASRLAPPILLAYVLQGWSQMNDVGIHVKERTELITAANWIAAAIALLGYALLIPRMHAMGAAVATLIAFFVRWVLVYSISQRLWRVHYRWAPVLRLTALAVGAVLLEMVVPDEMSVRSLGLRLGIAAMYAVGLWTLGIFTHDERAVVRRLVSNPALALASLRS